MNTLFDKIWDAHVVSLIEDGPTQLYIDRLYCHEVTSPQAFDGLRARGIKCLRPQQIFCMPDHNTPTHDQDKPIEDPVSKAQVDALTRGKQIPKTIHPEETVFTEFDDLSKIGPRGY